MSNMRYKIIGFKECKLEKGQFIPRIVEVVEFANTKSDANLMYDIMLEDESMCGHIQITDMAKTMIVRHSMEDDKIDPI